MKRILLIAFAGLTGLTQAQVKKKNSTVQKQKTEKKWVNPVKLTKEERNRPYMDEVLKTKDTITPEEAERRRKNIAVGNPFAKYGVYPKIATLSKGKYLEFHDLEKVVNIGSVKFDRRTKEITEFRKIDLSDPDAQPYLDTAGRWISPDPLSEEFSSWSPYNYAFNNPVKNVDPDGRAPFSVVPPDDHFNQFGQFLYTDNKPTNNIVIDFQNPITGKLNTAPWLSTELKDYSFNKGNMQTLINIGNYYADQAGVDVGNLRNESVSVAMWNDKVYSGGSPDRDKGEYKTFNGGQYCYDCLMQSNKEEKTISIQVNEHKVDSKLNNKYNFMSTMEHEGSAKTPSHFSVNVKPRDISTKGQRNEHLKIYEYQTTKSSFFKKTTPEFQKLINNNYRDVKNGATGN
ncbi:RHS repeat-associated core domain-containing protein [Chryseobacterium sp.]|uniref:RHS repeat-associated core domain-containing protein n=1 Tax=Chryseobacterium sp. TaxID=1871047 RepID=UPI0035B47B19